MINVYRIQLFRWDIEPKDGLTFKNKDEYRNYCLTKGRLGCGWPAKLAHCSSIEEYEEYVEKMFHKPKKLKTLSEAEQKQEKIKHPYSNHKSWKTTVNALKNMKKGDLCWTLGENGKYYLGEIEDDKTTIVDSSTCEYTEYPEMGLFRKCKWHPYELDQTPGKVIASLIQGGTLHQIYNVTEYSKHLIHPQNDETNKKIDFYALLHPDDLEDLLGLYLQSKGYYIFPSTNKRGTELFEYILVQKDTKKRAVIQCKIGDDEISDENIKIFIKDYQNYDVFIATVKDKVYLGENIETIKMKTLKKFAKDNEEILPLRIKNFLNW